MTSFILASASPIRATLLKNAGASAEIRPARVDEDELKAALRAEKVSPRDQADHLAEAKALAISRRAPGMLVLGADQILAFGEESYDKPKDLDEARRQLQLLRGETHRLYSAAVIAQDGAPIWRAMGEARLTMRLFTDTFLNEYLATIGEDAMTTVGGYKIEGPGAQLFSAIRGDHFAILGLPLLEVLDFLRIRGIMPT